MLTKGELSNALEVYWQDATRCFNSKAFWCLLHVTVSLPDVCAALESPDGHGLSQLNGLNRRLDVLAAPGQL